MGDILSLVEKAEESIKADDAEVMMKRIMEQKFDFNDFLKQTKMTTGMGGMSSVSRMIPGKGSQSAEYSSALLIRPAWMGTNSCDA